MRRWPTVLYDGGAVVSAAWEGIVLRTLVGLLAAVSTTMAALASLIRGDLVPVMITGASGAAGLAAYLALPSSKKT
jgi:hypothetical protein